MRICKDCKIEKHLEEFHRQGISTVTGEMRYRWRCKKCHNLKFDPPTGKPPSRFKKGRTPWNKGKRYKFKSVRLRPGFKPSNGFKEGHTPWNKGKRYDNSHLQEYHRERRRVGTCKSSSNYKNWKDDVWRRDNYECTKCGSKDKLCAHHIKPWKEYSELRFEIDNGITLCRSCHMKVHEFGVSRKGCIPWNKKVEL